MQSPAYDAWCLIKVQCMFIIAIILELHSFYRLQIYSQNPSNYALAVHEPKTSRHAQLI